MTDADIAQSIIAAGEKATERPWTTRRGRDEWTADDIIAVNPDGSPRAVVCIGLGDWEKKTKPNFAYITLAANHADELARKVLGLDVRLAECEREKDEWRVNHNNQVRIKRELSEKYGALLAENRLLLYWLASPPMYADLDSVFPLTAAEAERVKALEAVAESAKKYRCLNRSASGLTPDMLFEAGREVDAALAAYEAVKKGES